MISKAEIERVLRERISAFQATIAENERYYNAMLEAQPMPHGELQNRVLSIRDNRVRRTEDRDLAKALGIEIEEPVADKTS